MVLWIMKNCCTAAVEAVVVVIVDAGVLQDMEGINGGSDDGCQDHEFLQQRQKINHNTECKHPLSCLPDLLATLSSSASSSSSSSASPTWSPWMSYYAPWLEIYPSPLSPLLGLGIPTPPPLLSLSQISWLHRNTGMQKWDVQQSHPH